MSGGGSATPHSARKDEAWGLGRDLRDVTVALPLPHQLRLVQEGDRGVKHPHSSAIITDQPLPMYLQTDMG